MFKPATIRVWSAVHTWTSIVSTLFLLILCITGLPLVFHAEIDSLSVQSNGLPILPPATSLRSLDDCLRAALATRPGEVPLYFSFDEDRPVVNVTTGPHPDAEEAAMHFMSVDQRTAALIPTPSESGVVHFFLQLHKDLFLG